MKKRGNFGAKVHSNLRLTYLAILCWLRKIRLLTTQSLHPIQMQNTASVCPVPTSPKPMQNNVTKRTHHTEITSSLLPHTRKVGRWRVCCHVVMTLFLVNPFCLYTTNSWKGSCFLQNHISVTNMLKLTSKFQHPHLHRSIKTSHLWPNKTASCENSWKWILITMKSQPTICHSENFKIQQKN